MSDTTLFNSIFAGFQEKYPNTDIYMIGTLVYLNGDCIFNTDGFSLLYNLKRLCDALCRELL